MALAVDKSSGLYCDDKRNQSVLKGLLSPIKQRAFCKTTGLLVIASSAVLLSGCLPFIESSAKEDKTTEVVTSSVVAEKPTATAEKESVTVADQMSPSTHIDAPSMYQLLVGEMMVQKGYDQQAFEVIYDLALKKRSPELAERAFQLSMKTFDAAKVEAATNLWRELSPDSVVAWRASYLISLRNSDVNLAVEQWQYFQQISPETLSQDFMLTAQRVIVSIPVETGLAFFKTLSEQYADNWYALYALASAADAYGQYPIALDAAEKARSLQVEQGGEDEALLYQLLAKLYVQMPPPERGLTSLASYIQKNPEDWLVQERVARLEVQAELFEQASVRYKQILKSVPEAHTSRLSLSLIQIEQKSYDEAKANLLKVLEQHGYVDVASYYLGLIAQDQEDVEAALTYFARVKSENYYLDAQLHSAEIHFAAQDMAKALEVLDSVLLKNPVDKVKVYRAKGVFYTFALQPEVAIEQYDKALELDPNNIPILMAQALIFYNTEQFESYVAVLKRVLEIKPEHVNALNALGYYYVDTSQKMAEAEVMLNKAYSLAPDSYYVLDSLGWLYYQQKNYRLAEEYLYKALSIEMDDEVLIHLISTYWKQGRTSKAKDLWQANQQKFLNNKELQGLIKQLELE